MKRMLWVALVLAVLIPLFGGCTATDALMNRDKLQMLEEQSENERDTNISKTTPPSITQTGAAGGGEGGGAPQVMVLGDDVAESLAEVVTYVKSTEEQRDTLLKLKDIKKLNLFGYAIAGVIIVALFVYVWRKTRTTRLAAQAALSPISARIKMLVESLKTEADAEKIAATNAKIVELSGLEHDAKKKMNGAA